MRALVVIAAAFACRSAPGAGPSDPPPPNVASPDAAVPAADPDAGVAQQTLQPTAPASCTAAQITVETCVVGGADDGSGIPHKGCHRSCESSAPTDQPDLICKQAGKNHYRCTGYAPSVRQDRDPVIE